MKNGQNNITDELLARYVAGEAIAAEQEIVQQWLNENKENKHLLNDYKLIWAQSKHALPQSNVDEHAAWLRFKMLAQAERSSNVAPFPQHNPRKWLKIAAGLLLLVGGGYSIYSYSTQNNSAPLAQQTISTPPEKNIAVQQPVVVAPPVTTPVVNIIAPLKTAYSLRKQHDNFLGKHEMSIGLQKRQSSIFFDQHHRSLNRYASAESNDKEQDQVCNSTPCPLEICITQTLQCGVNKPSTASTCSIIEPDQSGQLCYKGTNNTDRNCALTVDQITIKRVSTGETILLTADSKPSTAWQVFNYITGQEKGDILAGIFHNDCGNNAGEHELTIDNNSGGLQLQ